MYGYTHSYTSSHNHLTGEVTSFPGLESILLTENASAAGIDRSKAVKITVISLSFNYLLPFHMSILPLVYVKVNV